MKHTRVGLKNMGLHEVNKNGEDKINGMHKLDMGGAGSKMRMAQFLFPSFSSRMGQPPSGSIFHIVTIPAKPEKLRCNISI